MQTVSLIKCHGSGNDFFIIDELNQQLPLTEKQRSVLAVTICNRQSGLGADGILFVQPSEHADAKMRIFNSDGSEASMCGNGLRCVGRYVHEKTKRDSFIIETMKANLRVEKTADIFPSISTFKVEISPVSFTPSDLPMKTELNKVINEPLSFLDVNVTFTAVAVPNPHLIAIVEEEQLHSTLQEEIATALNQKNEWFPDGVNVSFVKIIQKNEIFVKTYERGVGFTNACGTAMSASSLVTTLLGINELETGISVYNPGGMVTCVVHSNDYGTSIDLIGNATYEYELSITFNVNTIENFTHTEKHTFIDESNRYSNFQKEVREYLQSHR